MKIELPTDKKAIIDSLSALVAERRTRLQTMGMQNVASLNEADRMRTSMAYAQARAELMNAEDALRAAIRSQEG